MPAALPMLENIFKKFFQNTPQVLSLILFHSAYVPFIAIVIFGNSQKSQKAMPE
jgi:hypothetical protein